MYAKILTPNGWVDFNPRPYQSNLLDELKSEANVLVKSDRQMGLTTTIYQYIIDRYCNDPEFTCLIIYPSTSECKMRADILYKMIKSVGSTDLTIDFDISERISIMSSKTVITLCGSRLDFKEVFIENAEFCNIVELYSALLMLMSKNSKLKFIGHTVDLDMLFNDRHLIRWPYTLNSTFNNPEWIANMKDILGEHRFNLEFQG